MLVIKGMSEWGKKNKGSHIDRARETQTQRAEVTHTHIHAVCIPSISACVCERVRLATMRARLKQEVCWG